MFWNFYSRGRAVYSLAQCDATSLMDATWVASKRGVDTMEFPKLEEFRAWGVKEMAA